MTLFKDITAKDAFSFLAKALAAALAYGILLGQVIQIDQRLARVEVAILNHSFSSHAVLPLVPRAEAAPKPKEESQ